MNETAGERLKRSTQDFINSGGDPATAVIQEIIIKEHDRYLGKVMDRITEFKDGGVETESCGFFTYDNIASSHCKIHMQLKRGEI